MNVREIAFQSLLTICRDEGYSNIVVSKAIQTHQFADRDRRFYTELVYGTLRCLNYLDWIISQISTRKLQKLDPVCLAIIRLGLYQIFGMTKVPESAACNEAVKMATKFGNRGMAKFVNAMLRNSIRRRSQFVIPDKGENIVAHLALRCACASIRPRPAAKICWPIWKNKACRPARLPFHQTASTSTATPASMN